MNDEKSCVSRALQLELLVRLRDVWPRPMREFPKIDGISDDEIIRNLVYLEEHRLCSSGLLAGIDENYSYGGARITAIGLDFLEDDGGLSAILKTVTIKVHADTLRDMFNSKIETSALPQTEKSELKERIKSLPQKVLETATSDLVKAGLNNIPNFVEWMHKMLSL